MMDLQSFMGFSFSWGEPPHLLTAPWLAKWLGLYITIMAVYSLLRRNTIQSVVADIKTSPGLAALSAGLSVLIGSLIIALHPWMEADWSILISLFGYITLLRGVAFLFFPQEVIKFFTTLDRHSIFLFIWSVLWLVVGLILMWFGFFHKMF